MRFSPTLLKLLSLLLLLVGVVLHILHLTEPSTNQLLFLFGFVGFLRAYGQQVRQLQAENDELRRQLGQP